MSRLLVCLLLFTLGACARDAPEHKGQAQLALENLTLSLEVPGRPVAGQAVQAICRLSNRGPQDAKLLTTNHLLEWCIQITDSHGREPPQTPMGRQRLPPESLVRYGTRMGGPTRNISARGEFVDVIHLHELFELAPGVYNLTIAPMLGWGDAQWGQVRLETRFTVAVAPAD